MSYKNILAGAGLVFLAGLSAVGAAVQADEKEKREDASIGSINIPSDEMQKIRGRRVVLNVEGSEVRKVDPSSFIETKWLVWGAKFRPYMGKNISRVELDATINPGETVSCYYYCGKENRARKGYVTIMETSSRW